MTANESAVVDLGFCKGGVDSHSQSVMIECKKINISSKY